MTAPDLLSGVERHQDLVSVAGTEREEPELGALVLRAAGVEAPNSGFVTFSALSADLEREARDVHDELRLALAVTRRGVAPEKLLEALEIVDFDRTRAAREPGSYRAGRARA